MNDYMSDIDSQEEEEEEEEVDEEEEEKDEEDNLLNFSINSLSSTYSTQSDSSFNVQCDDTGRVNIPDYDTIDCMSNNELVAYLEKLNYGSDPSLKTEFDMRARLKLERVRWKQKNHDQTHQNLFVDSMHEEIIVQRVHIKDELTHCSKLATKIKTNQYFSDASQSDKFVEHLEKKINNFDENFNQLKDMFDREYYPILVTGEVSSGKSTFINLLLQEDLLPTAYTAISSTICEIRHVKFAQQVGTWSKTMTRIAYIHPLQHGQPIIIVEDSDTFVEDMSKYLGNINDRSDAKYKKVELFISNKNLENGLCIVDSPGFSENDVFNQMLRMYFKNALAFIYIIKTTAAGGIQENGLERVMREIREICLDGQHGYRWDSAIFVFNMWDEVKSNKKDILRHLTEKLVSNFSTLKESQIFTLSSKSARYLQKHDLVAEDLQPILDRVKYLLQTAIFNQYTLIYGAMMQFVRVSIQLLDSFLYQIKIEQNELEERYKRIFSRLNELQKNADHIIENMRESLTFCEKEGLEILCNHLKMTDTQQRIVDKMVKIEPPNGIHWWQIEAQLRDKVAKVIKEELCKFECNSPFFHRLRQNTFQRFREAFVDLETKVNELERELAGYDSNELDISALTLACERPQDRLKENKFWEKVGALNTSEMIAFGVAMPLLVPLGIAAGMIALPVIGVFTVKERFLHFYRRRQIERYNSNDAEKVKLIKDVTRKLIARYHKNSPELKAYVKFEMSIIFDILKQLKLAVAKQFQDDKDQILDLMNERRDKEVIRRFYEPLREIFKWKRRTLLSIKTLYLFSNMMDLPMNFLEKGDQVFCHGLCSDLFHGRVRKNLMIQLDKTDVSVRRLSCQISANNIEKYLKEEEFYKYHDNKHILKAKAVAKRPTLIALTLQLPSSDPSNDLLLLCEPVSYSLREYLQKILPDPIHVLRCDIRFVNLSNIVKQILNGLTFLHSRDCTHYDLTLDTLAVIGNNSAVIVKLTNIRWCAYFKEIAQHLPTSEFSNVRKIAHLDYEIIKHVCFLVDAAALNHIDEMDDLEHNAKDLSTRKSNSDSSIKIDRINAPSETSCFKQKIKLVNRMEYSRKHDIYSLAMVMYEAWTGARIEDEWSKYWRLIELGLLNNNVANHSSPSLRSSCTSNCSNTLSLSTTKMEKDIQTEFNDLSNVIKRNKNFNEATFYLSAKSFEQDHHQEWLNSIVEKAVQNDHVQCTIKEDDVLDNISKSLFNCDSMIQISNKWMSLIQSCWMRGHERLNCEGLHEKLNLY